MKIKYALFSACALIAVLGVAGCQKQDAASIVQQRALERWNLLITHQPIKAYDYLSPGYRATHTLDQYVAFIATARLKWKEAKVDGQKCDAETCTVNLTIKSDIPGHLIKMPRDIEHEAPVIEHWISSEGQWYFLPDSRIQPTEVTTGEAPATAVPAPVQPGEHQPATPAAAPAAQQPAPQQNGH
jgi:hypothetical protein